VTDPKNKPVLDERTFEKLLEAAYVIQTHRGKMGDAEAKMESLTERLREQERESVQQAPLEGSKPEPEESSRADGEYTLTLSEIVEVQRQIQARHLELDKALAVVAEKVARITDASGAAIGILEEKMVRYRAGTGTPALPLESEVPLASAICAACVRTGQVIRSEDVNTEVLFDPEPCRLRGILSLVAVPIYHDGDIVGALEVYFDQIHGFSEPDIHTCRLMAGLVTEAMGRDAELKLQKSVAAERSTMLAAIEKLQPNLAALAGEQFAASAGTDAEMQASEATAAISECWKCGNTLVAEEQFCGRCGAPRVTDDESYSIQSKLASAWHMEQTGHESIAAAPSYETSTPEDSTPEETRHLTAADDTDAGANDNDEPPSMQNKVASAWHMEQTGHESVAAAPPYETSPPEATTQSIDTRNEADLEDDTADAYLPEPSSSRPELEETAPEFAESLNAGADEGTMTESLSTGSQIGGDEDHVEAPSAALEKPRQEDERMVWSSAARARDFLESLSATREPSAIARFWRSRRGDFYLAVAVILMVVVIRWGIWSNHPVGATGSGTSVSSSASRHKPPAPDADLSLFDRLLIGLGLADPPDDAPEYKGNPDTQVWVDLQTALYYCPGSDLYSKTPKGKLASQREAQLDQFEPAYRKPCD
jgi:putative methionine-R-sulfoxide reductase with GAF domain